MNPSIWPPAAPGTAENARRNPHREFLPGKQLQQARRTSDLKAVFSYDKDFVAGNPVFIYKNYNKTVQKYDDELHGKWLLCHKQAGAAHPVNRLL